VSALPAGRPMPSKGPPHPSADTSDPDGEVRGSAEYMAKVVNRSNSLPVIWLAHVGWRDRAPEAWRILREAVRAAGRPIGSACIDTADPSNAHIQQGLILLRSRYSLDVPLLGIEVLGQTDDGVTVAQHPGDSLAGAIDELVRRATFVFYGASALPPSPPP
jgi:hypothetical protein